MGLTVRAHDQQHLRRASIWDRTVYAGRRNVAPDLQQIEHRDRLIGPIFSFQVRGKF